MTGDWAVSSYSNGFSPETKQNLHDLYSNRCAICGQKRESPFGRPEAEAAHIHPVQHGGPDRETNGLLLCRRCHWGFDSGWLSLRDDYSIIVADATSTHGYESFHQFSDRSLVQPSTDDLEPEVRFVQVHRKLFGFDPINTGDRLTIGGLRNRETRLVDGRRVIVEGSADDALLVNCSVTDTGPERVRCNHHRTLKRRSTLTADSPDSPFELTSSDITFDRLERYIREIKEEQTGVAQKWEWGRLFRRARTKYGYSHEEIAETIDVEGASALQVQRSERVYDMFPDRDYEEGGLSYSAIAELQRIFSQTDDARSAYDCIIATGHSLTVEETRAWVELLLAEREVTRESVRESLRQHGDSREAGFQESVRRVLDVQAEYESSYSGSSA
ncbi:putative restriction endonuclease [Halopelagius inordinatus]|uniref:Putative restriction endonuclease n=1 Tax=Halopelagius inordinatus TaxID=553467 RepID=A0A1I2NB70_9EURY|nr:HNH endonuclease [Halopelagius inordinatus]SFG01104.1 putative restriction endonuclease [Halopelagius inordinatus]